MIINKEIKKILPISNLKDCYVVTDFDRTITNESSKTSWSVLAGSKLVPKEYIDERKQLYDKYRPIEIDETMNFSKRSLLVSEWFRKHIELLVKYRISEELFEKAANDLRIMEFRNGAREFLEFLYNNNIPLIIISAGIGNFIECFLKKNNCLYSNIYISSNKIIFKNGIATGVDDDIIHSLNKNEVSLSKEIKEKIKDKKKVLLLGDQISDLKMVAQSSEKKIIKIGFHSSRADTSLIDFKILFDIVCDDSDDFNVLKNAIFMKNC